jgi:hypothetical protein
MRSAWLVGRQLQWGLGIYHQRTVSSPPEADLTSEIHSRYDLCDRKDHSNTRSSSSSSQITTHYVADLLGWALPEGEDTGSTHQTLVLCNKTALLRGWSFFCERCPFSSRQLGSCFSKVRHFCAFFLTCSRGFRGIQSAVRSE